MTDLENILNELRTNYGTTAAAWAEVLLKTALSKNITIAEWNSLVAHAGQESDDVKRVVDAISDVIQLVGTEDISIPDASSLTDAVNKNYSSVSKKADKSWVNNALSTKASATWVNGELKLKANTTYVDAELAKKANTEDVNAELADKANSKDLPIRVDLVYDNQSYKFYVKITKQGGDTLVSDEIDLPLESVVVNAELSSDGEKLILDLKNGNTAEIPISDILRGVATVDWVEEQISEVVGEVSNVFDDLHEHAESLVGGEIIPSCVEIHTIFTNSVNAVDDAVCPILDDASILFPDGVITELTVPNAQLFVSLIFIGFEDEYYSGYGITNPGQTIIVDRKTRPGEIKVINLSDGVNTGEYGFTLNTHRPVAYVRSTYGNIDSIPIVVKHYK